MTNKTRESVVSMRELLECGVHFGHQTKRWNPKMKKYIFTARNGIHVIDLQQTIKLIRKAYQFVREISRNNGLVLFVGTKKQAQDAIKTEAEHAGMPYVNHRWLGGTLTNHLTVRQSINKLKALQKMVEEGEMDKLSNKEASSKKKKLARLEYYLSGIKDMTRTPEALLVVDTKKEQIAVNEANRLNIPIIGIIDTNADPGEIQYPIPANDDAIRAIKLICSVMSQAVMDGVSERKAGLVQAEEEKAQQEASVENNKSKETEKIQEEV
ncbi:30S ribosomal protein S2 [Thermoproteota archaeon]